MITSLPYFICVFALLIYKASLQIPTVEGFIGGSALLPCSSTEDASKQDIFVYWRDGSSKIVFDLIKGEASMEQDQRYKNRVESFPQEYLRRNFSIKLNNLQPTDDGKYTCLISHSLEQPAVRLIINESYTENGNKPSEPDNQGKKTESSSTLLQVVIALMVLILILAVVYVLFRYKKKIQSAFSPVMTENTSDSGK